MPRATYIDPPKTKNSASCADCDWKDTRTADVSALFRHVHQHAKEHGHAVTVKSVTTTTIRPDAR